jgi:adenosine deaminase
MHFTTFLARIPKAELHNHIIGTLRPTTLGDLAAKHGLALPRPAERLYDFTAFDEFLDVLRLAASALRTGSDFARVAYEAVEDGYRAGNLRHVEFLFNPQYFYPYGVNYRTMVDGMTAGLREAQADFGVTALLVPSFDRCITPAAALDIMDDIENYRTDLIAGIGLDGAERNGPPQTFAAIYERAARAGLKRTAHVCEDNQTLTEAPPGHYDICRDLLKCDRLDHGYNLLTDADTIGRAQDDGLTFNVCTVTSVKANRVGRRARIAHMVELGLNVTLSTDDAAMFKTDLAECFQLMFEGRDWGVTQARAFSLASVDACWLPESDKRDLRRRFEHEIDTLAQDLEPA